MVVVKNGLFLSLVSVKKWLLFYMIWKATYLDGKTIVSFHCFVRLNQVCKKFWPISNCDLSAGVRFCHPRCLWTTITAPIHHSLRTPPPCLAYGIMSWEWSRSAEKILLHLIICSPPFRPVTQPPDTLGVVQPPSTITTDAIASFLIHFPQDHYSFFLDRFATNEPNPCNK